MPELVKVWLDTHVDLTPEGGKWYDAGQHFLSHAEADELAKHGATFPDRGNGTTATVGDAAAPATTPEAAESVAPAPEVPSTNPVAPQEA